MTFAQQVLQFHFQLKPDWKLPAGVELIYPFGGADTRAAMTAFYEKYFSDTQKRVFIFGINPGRFGAGVTGVPFTDPLRVADDCGIPNDFAPKRELSSEYVYQFIHAFGGPELFYQHFYITSICPLGFLKDGKNYNYYDRKTLERAMEPHIIDNIKTQLSFGGRTDLAICMGEGQNYKYFDRINKAHRFFDRIIPLAHPRYIMQYKRKLLSEYLEQYISALQEASQL